MVMCDSDVHSDGDDVGKVVEQALVDGDSGACCTAASMTTNLQTLHNQHHLGVDRTLFLARKVDANVSSKAVEEVVAACGQCRSIDPAPIRWETGNLGVDHNWRRLAADITHYNNACYLSVIDCGPSRFTIWRKVIREDSGSICWELRQIFREHGSPVKLLLDNGLAFKSSQLGQLCTEFGVRRTFRCAYRASGNGIVERVHRTIKRMAARSHVVSQFRPTCYHDITL
jgi:transposase InsO family protein